MSQLDTYKLNKDESQIDLTPASPGTANAAI
jgi:hypothetical protein